MPTFELTLSPGYVSDWGFVEATRELFQNALDKQTTDPENTLFYKLDRKAGRLLIGSKNSVLERKTLLLGQTSKAADDKTIGKFGEGYKLAILVLRRNGYGVRIYNYGAKEIWLPNIIDSKQYKAQVLAVNVSRYILRTVPDHNLVFEIEGVKPEDFDLLEKRNLNVSYSGSAINTSGGRVLLDEEHRGQVFVSGLYVTTIKDDKVKYGYDFSPSRLKLDRDRGMVTDIDVFFETAKLWSEVKDPEQQKLLAEMIKDGNTDAKYCTWYTPKQDVQVLVAGAFQQQYGKMAVPVTSQEEADKLKRTSPKHRPIFTNEVHAQTVRAVIAAPKASAQIDKDKEVTPEQHLLRLLRRVRSKLSVSDQTSFNRIVKLSQHWKWD